MIYREMPAIWDPAFRRHFYDANTVRQLSEGSMDGGKTWQVEYDLTCHRRVK